MFFPSVFDLQSSSSCKMMKKKELSFQINMGGNVILFYFILFYFILFHLETMKKRKCNSKVSIRLSCILLSITPTYYMLKEIQGGPNRLPNDDYTGSNWHQECLVPPSSLLVQRLLNKDNKLSPRSCNQLQVLRCSSTKMRLS